MASADLAGALTADEKIFLLSFDRGTISAYCSLLILKNLMSQIETIEKSADDLRPCQYFDYVAGTGTGGIIALFVGRLQMTVDEAIDSYKYLATEIFNHPRHLGRFSFQPRFEAAQLENTLNAIINRYAPLHQSSEKFGRIANNKCQTVIIASVMDSKGERPHNFSTFPPAAKPEQDSRDLAVDPIPRRVNETDQSSTLDQSLDLATTSASILHVARAALAESSLFAPVEINGLKFADGAASGNNPTLRAMEEIRRVCASRECFFDDTKYGGVINIGVRHSGSKETFVSHSPYASRRSSLSSAGHMPTIFRVLSGGKKSTSDGQAPIDWDDDVTKALRLLKDKLGMPYFRFDPSNQFLKIRISSSKPFNKRLFDTVHEWITTYLQDEEVQERMEQCARMLVDNKKARTRDGSVPTGGPPENPPPNPTKCSELKDAILHHKSGVDLHQRGHNQKGVEHSANHCQNKTKGAGNYQAGVAAGQGHASSFATHDRSETSDIRLCFAKGPPPLNKDSSANHTSGFESLLKWLLLVPYPEMSTTLMTPVDVEHDNARIIQPASVLTYMVQTQSNQTLTIHPGSQGGRSSSASQSTSPKWSTLSSAPTVESTAATSISIHTDNQSNSQELQKGKERDKTLNNMWSNLQERPKDWAILFHINVPKHEYHKHHKLHEHCPNRVGILDIPRFGRWSIHKQEIIRAKEEEMRLSQWFYTPNTASAPFGLRFQRTVKGRLKLVLNNPRVQESPKDFSYIIDSERRPARRM